MKKGNTTIVYEFESDINKNYNKILELSGYDDDDYPLELELNVDFNYHYDKGRYYGAWEDCYPSEWDFEVVGVSLSDEKVDITGLLSDKDYQKIEEIVQLELEL